MTPCSVTVDVVVFTILDRSLHVLLIKRLAKPYSGRFALPGGFVLENESVDAAAIRELREETGVRDLYLEQLYTFGEPKRDPRGRVITVAYYALIPPTQTLHSTTDAAEAAWFRADELPTLAFDHAQIVDYARTRLRNKLAYTNVGFELLPERFTLSELQAVHEAILGEPLDKRNFRRQILQRPTLQPLQAWKPTGRKPAQLFRFKE